jgi:hypothetical protein
LFSRPNITPPPAAADIFVLIGNVLTPGHEVRQNSTERQTLRQAGGSRRLDDARGEQRAQRSVTSVDWNL